MAHTFLIPKYFMILNALIMLSVSQFFGAKSCLHAQTMEEAGILQRTITYINNCNYANNIKNDKRFKNCLRGIISTEAVPSNAKEITGTGQYSQIQSGGTYVIRGNLTGAPILNVPGNVTIYVDGSIKRNGNHSSGENGTDAVFMVKNKSNVKIIGVNNAKLTGNRKTTGVYVTGSSNVTVKGFEINDMWEGLVARGGTLNNVMFMNNYIHDTVRRAIWFLMAKNSFAVHNFTDNAGWDGIDWDAHVKNIKSFENVAISAGRWCGFVEEAAQNCEVVCNVGIMADFWPSNGMYQMGWCDNGTTQKVIDNSGKLTKDNYFIGNVMYEPTSYNSTGGGNYFANKNADKGMTYFWGNDEFGCGHGGNKWYKAEWKDDVTPAGQKIIDEMDALYNTTTNIVSHSGSISKIGLHVISNNRNGTVIFRLNMPKEHTFENSDIVLDIFNLQGKLVRSITTGTFRNNTFACRWDVNNGNHGVVGKGLYTALLRMENDKSLMVESFILSNR